ncbi:MAG: hypothetical protein FWF94_01515 [Oscillospiraceae bacterium]|nr:hypothetical protein [Oscillospiraceae bacterium]
MFSATDKSSLNFIIYMGIPPVTAYAKAASCALYFGKNCLDSKKLNGDILSCVVRLPKSSFAYSPSPEHDSHFKFTRVVTRIQIC